MLDFWKNIYKKHNISISDLKPEKESVEYFACDAIFEGKNAKFRISKITPKKVGQFVTLWKREINGPIQPFDALDNIDFVIIAIQNDEKIGQFIFPKSILISKGIFTDKKEGKRAIRVYPSWDIAVNPQAIKTQKWQLEYFSEFDKT